MSLVLDTSIVIDVLRAVPAALRYTRALSDPPICSEVTRVEVLRGLRSTERKATEQLFATFDWIGMDEPVARRAGELGRSWRRGHRAISTTDLIIAATAAELGVGLATLNTKHFPMFPGLRAPYRG